MDSPHLGAGGEDSESREALDDGDDMLGKVRNSFKFTVDDQSAKHD